MKQKLGLVQALQCRPQLAFLDEPTKGLDPLVQQAFYDIVFEARTRGTTVFFSSHVLPEVERVCDRVAILRAGRLVAAGTIEEVLHVQRRRVRVAFAPGSPKPREGGSPDYAAWLADFGEIVSRSDTHVELLVERAKVPELVRAAASRAIADLTIEPLRLEDAFLEHYR